MLIEVDFQGAVESDPDRRGGIPVLRDTRFPFAKVVAELADGYTVAEIADDYELEYSALLAALSRLSVAFSEPPK